MSRLALVNPYLDGVIGDRFSPIVLMTRLPHTAKPTMMPTPP